MILTNIQIFLEKIDSWRDKFLCFFIKRYWPRFILPNHITWIRVFISILLFVLLFWFGVKDKVLILSLFAIGVLTDFIDGPIARCFNQTTEFGAMLDSTADKILIMPIAVWSLYQYHKWLLLILILMEIFNAIASILYKSKEIYLESNIYGKVKMVIESIAFLAILFSIPSLPHQIFLDALWLTVPLTLISIFARLAEIYPLKIKI